MNPEIAAKIDDIRLDRMHGAAWLSREAIAVLKLAAEMSEAETIDDFLAEIKGVARRLSAARPAMAPIANNVSRFVYEVLTQFEEGTGLDQLKSLAHAKGDELIRDVEKAALEAAEKGAEAIEDGDSVMTCSYSSTICRVFKLAKLNGKSFEVLVAESKYGSKRYGAIAVNELMGQGILAMLVSDNAIRDNISTAKKVLVGADSILRDGSLINGIPTYELALAAKDCNIPFYSVCETAKFNIQSYFELEPGFDHIPPNLIAGIITEKGMIKPDEVARWIEEMRRYDEFTLPG